MRATATCGEIKALCGEFEMEESSTTCTGKRWGSPRIEKILHDLLGIKNGENHTLLEIYQKASAISGEIKRNVRDPLGISW